MKYNRKLKSPNCFELWNVFHVFGTIFGQCEFPKYRINCWSFGPAKTVVLLDRCCFCWSRAPVHQAISKTGTVLAPLGARASTGSDDLYIGVALKGIGTTLHPVHTAGSVDVLWHKKHYTIFIFDFIWTISYLNLRCHTCRYSWCTAWPQRHDLKTTFQYCIFVIS